MKSRKLRNAVILSVALLAVNNITFAKDITASMNIDKDTTIDGGNNPAVWTSNSSDIYIDIQNGATLTLESDYEYGTILGYNANINFSGANLVVNNNGGYGVYFHNNKDVNFKNENTLIEGAGCFGITVQDGNITAKNLTIDIDRSKVQKTEEVYGIQVWYDNSNLNIEKDTDIDIVASESDTGATGIDLLNKVGVVFNGITEIDVSGAKTNRGIRISGGDAEFKDSLTVTLGQGEILDGITTNKNTESFAAKDVTINLDAVNSREATGFMATGAKNTMESLTIKINNVDYNNGALDNAFTGINLNPDNKDTTLTVNGSTYVGIEGNDNMKSIAILTSDKSTIANFNGVTTLNAAGAVNASDGSKVNFNDDFISLHNDSLIYATEGAKVNVNINDKNKVKFTGKTDTESITSGGSNGEINMHLTTNDSYWNVTGDSTLTNLKNDSIVDMRADGNGFSTITVNNILNSGGTFNMDIDASTNVNNSDRIYVNRTHKGTHYIKLNPLDENKLDGAAGTVLVSVKDEQGEFKAKDSEGALYWNKYTLDRFDTSAGDKVTAGYNTDWYLKEVEQLDEPTTSVDTILGAYALGYHTWRAETDKLMKRMGDLRHNGEDEKGAWFRVRGAEISRDGEASFENKYTVYELGYDEITKKTDRFTRYQGAALSYIDGSSSFARGSGENNGKSIAFYTTEMRNKGHYLDLVFRIADMDSDYKVYDTNGNKITGEPENVGVSLSAEYGRKKVMDDNGWYIEPQGQLTLGYFGGDNYRAKYADQYIDVHQSGIPSVLGRVGFNIGRDIDENTNIYLKANLLHEFCGDYDVDMVDSAGNRRTESDTFNDTWFEYGIGAAIKTGKNNHIYFDFEKTAGGDFEQDWAWNAGMRWTF